MKILFIGDTVGSAGRNMVRQFLPELRAQFDIDATILNCENLAAGFGVTPKIAEEVLGYGIDVLTSGNHIWDKKEILPFLDDEERILRPANYPKTTPGRGSLVFTTAKGENVAVINLQGRVFMPTTDDPFQVVEHELRALNGHTRVIIVDMHAEATSEKVAMGWYLDGRVSAVLGTHTHVPTADARVLPGGTAYVTDVGMTGPYNSVIGMQKEEAIRRFTTQMPVKFESASLDPELHAIVLDIDTTTGKSRTIERIRRS